MGVGPAADRVLARPGAGGPAAAGARSAAARARAAAAGAAAAGAAAARAAARAAATGAGATRTGASAARAGAARTRAAFRAAARATGAGPPAARAAARADMFEDSRDAAPTVVDDRHRFSPLAAFDVRPHAVSDRRPGECSRRERRRREKPLIGREAGLLACEDVGAHAIDR